jgi:outer membrane protein OmpA-like peptidoglycan-associated protein
MSARFMKSVGRALTLALIASVPITLSAQTGGKSAPDDNPSRWDIFTGYSYLAPKGTVTVATPGHTANYDAVNVGGLFSGAYFFNRNIGVQAEFGVHEWGSSSSLPAGTPGSNIGTHGNDDGFLTVAGGLIGRFPQGNITPFIHGLVGTARVEGPFFQGPKWGPMLTAGGGMDYETPLFDHHIAIRLFQADFEYMHADFGPDPNFGGRANINAARLSTGLVFHAGSITPPPPATLACSASPTSVFPGEPITVTATAGSLEPKLNAIYSWSGSGASGNGTSTTVATTSLDPGNYSVKGELKEGKPGKEGLKPGQTADCTASFTVKAFEPPTISCSASPTTIKPGETSTITCTGMSPQNRPLTYSYTASAGTVTGSGTTASFASTGAPTGATTITGKVSDDKNQTATADTSVTIEPPPPPPGPSPEQVRLEARLALHSVFFPTDLPGIKHPEGGLLESQQGTLTTLATDFKSYIQLKPDAHLILAGHADKRGSAEYNKALSERRVARTKQFLVAQGVPEASIETQALGDAQNLTADEVKSLVAENPDLSDTERAKVLRKLNVIVLAQNRRVDISLSTTGQQSVRLYPFNAADSLTLLNEKAPTAGKKATGKKVK